MKKAVKYNVGGSFVVPAPTPDPLAVPSSAVVARSPDRATAPTEGLPGDTAPAPAEAEVSIAADQADNPPPRSRRGQSNQEKQADSTGGTQ